MSYDVVFREPSGQVTGFFLGTVAAVESLSVWAERLQGLPGHPVDAIKSLFVDGRCPDSRRLADELDMFQYDSASIQPGFREVLDNFRENLGRGLPGETVEIEE